MDRVETTLFMLESLDGKISTGDNDNMDVDKDLPKIDGVKEGLAQYYEIEKTTDLCSLNTGRVMAKIGVNERTSTPDKIPTTFVIIDSKPHLTESGVKYLSDWVNKLILVTTNEKHPAKDLKLDNVEVLSYESAIDFADLFERIKTEFGFERLTVQSGGTLNSTFIREGLIDHVSIVIAPALVGGKDTSTLADGESLHNSEDLSKIRPLKLVECKQLENSYLHLIYDVIN